MSIYKKIIAALIFLSSANYLHANCSKEDINYYLEKGFSHDQVTKLCSHQATPKNNNNYMSFKDEYIDTQDAEYQKRMRIERQVFLKGSIAARNIRIRGNTLTYLEEICGRTGLKNNAGETEGATAEGLSLIHI